jgi:hypothetical protein
MAEVSRNRPFPRQLSISNRSSCIDVATIIPVIATQKAKKEWCPILRSNIAAELV